MADRVIGVGNAERGDDAVGRVVARLLLGRVPSSVEILEHNGETGGLLEQMETADVLYIVDAAVSGRAAGSVTRFDCSAGPLPKEAVVVSTHGFGVASTVELARALGRLPPHCIVYAIEAGSVTAGALLSETVRASAEIVAARVVQELRLISDRRGSRPGRSACRDCEPC